ncbi:hypothetical protein [Streptomyces sp. Ru72]|uniref:hypothetical protein n=1 Tax=Streptomyces sp. Ru72 TaxID=2080747 RepID=UPI0011B0E0CA|nr:hypothetical protein [Streptomyces sp. Ru72]
MYEFVGCPNTGDHQQIADEDEPGEVVFRERPGGLGIIDGFVHDSVDEVMIMARFRWVAGGDPSTVAPRVLEAAGEQLPPATDEAGSQ